MFFAWYFQRWHRLLRHVPDQYLSEASGVIPELRARLTGGHGKKFNDQIVGYLFAEYLLSHPHISQGFSRKSRLFVRRKRRGFYRVLPMAAQNETDAMVEVLIWKGVIQRADKEVPPVPDDA